MKIKVNDWPWMGLTPLFMALLCYVLDHTFVSHPLTNMWACFMMFAFLTGWGFSIHSKRKAVHKMDAAFKQHTDQLEQMMMDFNTGTMQELKHRTLLLKALYGTLIDPPGLTVKELMKGSMSDEQLREAVEKAIGGGHG